MIKVKIKARVIINIIIKLDGVGPVDNKPSQLCPKEKEKGICDMRYVTLDM